MPLEIYMRDTGNLFSYLPSGQANQNIPSCTPWKSSTLYFFLQLSMLTAVKEQHRSNGLSCFFPSSVLSFQSGSYHSFDVSFYLSHRLCLRCHKLNCGHRIDPLTTVKLVVFTEIDLIHSHVFSHCCQSFSFI